MSFVMKVEGVNLSSNLLSQLVVAPPRAGMQESVWQTFFVGKSHKPLFIRVRKEHIGKMQTGVFNVAVYQFFKGTEMTSVEAKISYYRADCHLVETESRGQVDVFTSPRDANQDLRLGGQSLDGFELRFVGKEESCILYAQPQGVEFEPFAMQKDREILSRNNALIAVQGVERPIVGGTLVKVGDENPLTIIDHRSNRETPYGVVEYVRQGRLVHYDIYDLEGSRSHVAFMLTSEGLIPMQVELAEEI